MHKTDTYMAIVRTLKSFADERIEDSELRSMFLGFCAENGYYEELEVDVTSFENCWKKYKAKHP